jgi:small subunit ribosomal protein S8
MYTDPIADLLIRIKNAARARKDTVEAPYSKVKEQILANLQKKKFIESYSIESGEKEYFKFLLITLSNEHRDIETKRVSRPGQRIYMKAGEIKKINGGLGISIVSTPKGIVTDDEARKMHLGGEILCEIV